MIRAANLDRESHGGYQQPPARTHFSRAQRLTIVTAMLLFVVLINVLQLWLLTATVNAYLGGDTGVLLPSVLVSAACLALNAGLLWSLYRLDGRG